MKYYILGDCGYCNKCLIELPLRTLIKDKSKFYYSSSFIKNERYKQTQILIQAIFSKNFLINNAKELKNFKIKIFEE